MRRRGSPRGSVLEPLPSHSVKQAVLELCNACGSLLGPLRTIKCVIIEDPSQNQDSNLATRSSISSDAENCLWTSDALVFMRALPLRHPAAIAIRDACCGAWRVSGSGICTMVSYATRMTALVQSWKNQGVRLKPLSDSMCNAIVICQRAISLVAYSPPTKQQEPRKGRSNLNQLSSELARSLQHADPGLEAWSGSSSHASAGVSPLNVPMRVAHEALTKMISCQYHERQNGNNFLDLSGIRVTKLGGVVPNRSRADFGVAIEIARHEAQRFSRLFHESKKSSVPLAGQNQTRYHVANMTNAFTQQSVEEQDMQLHAQGVLLIDGDCRADGAGGGILRASGSSDAVAALKPTLILKSSDDVTKEFADGGSAMFHLDCLVRTFVKCFADSSSKHDVATKAATSGHSHSGLVLVKGSVSPHVTETCAAHGILVLEQVRYGDLEAVARATGSSLLGNPWKALPADTGRTGIALSLRQSGWVSDSDVTSFTTNRHYSGADAAAAARHVLTQLFICPLYIRHTSDAAMMPLEILLCSFLPKLLDDMETRFWKYLHRLRNALAISDNDIADEYGDNDEVNQPASPPLTILPGAGVTEAVMICALRHAAKLNRRSTLQMPFENSLAHADVFDGIASVFKEHLLQLLLNGGTQIELAIERLNTYLTKVGHALSSVMSLLLDDTHHRDIPIKSRIILARAHWYKCQKTLPQAILYTAYKDMIGDDEEYVVADDRVAKLEALKNSIRISLLVASTDGVLTNNPMIYR